MSVNRDLVRAYQSDIQRLLLLAELVVDSPQEGVQVDPRPAANRLSIVFPGAVGCLDEDVHALVEDRLVCPDDSPAGTGQVTVMGPGRELVEGLRATVAGGGDPRLALVATIALNYLHTHPSPVDLTTEFLQAAEVRLLGEPLPDGSVEEALKELHEMDLITGHWDREAVLRPEVSAKGREVVRSGRAVLLPDEGHAGASSVFNTTINGGIQGQNVAVASQGGVNQEATVNVDQTMADLRVAVDALYEALDGQADLQGKIEQHLDQLDAAEDQEDRSLMARALSGLRRLASKAADKGVEPAVTAAVSETTKLLMGLLVS